MTRSARGAGIEGQSVSVVIPAWRNPRFLRDAIRSTQVQAGVTVEVIVIDDCSPHDIKNAIADLDCPVIYHRHPENRGTGAARNTGVEMASHEIVAFLDDDDVWLQSKLAKQLPVLRNNGACLCGFQLPGSGRKTIHDITNVTEDLLRRGNYLCGTSGLVAWRETMLSVPFDEALPRGQDWDVYVRLAQAGGVGYVAEALFEYRRESPESITMSSLVSNPAALRGIAEALYKHREWLGENHFKRRLATYCLAYLYKRRDFMSAIGLSVRHAGAVATAKVLFEKVIRTERHY